MSKTIIRLRDVVDALELQGDGMKAYLNRQTGVVTILSDEELRAAENDATIEDFPDWQHDNIRTAIAILATDDYLQLPDQYEIHEWSIMRDFCETVTNPHCRKTLLDSIHGKGAFRHFKDILYRFGMEEQWYRFHKEALQQIAKEWLTDNKLAYQENDSLASSAM